MTTVLIPMAHGVEEMEAVIVADILRRAKWQVTLAGISQEIITAARGIRLVCDCPWEEACTRAFDVIVIPGGAAGVEALLGDNRVTETVARMALAGKLVAAVCAGPLVLHKAGTLTGKRVTSHLSVAERLQGTRWADEPVVVDGNIVTSQGAGTSFLFALEILRRGGASEEAAAIARATAFKG